MNVLMTLSQLVLGAATESPSEEAGCPCWQWLATGVLLFLSLWAWLPNGYQPSRFRRMLGLVGGVTGVLLLWWNFPTFLQLGDHTAFWLLAALTMSGAIATISAHSPVYSAIWFAVTLLGTAGLYLVQQSQFLSIATIAVYAGAIVVTFLFVLMLSQPSGHANYDRLSWGLWPRLLASLSGTCFVLIVCYLLGHLDRDAWSAVADQSQAIESALVAQYPQISVRSLQFARQPNDVSSRRIARVAVALPEGQTLTHTERDQLAKLASDALAAAPHPAPVDVVTITVEDTRTPFHMARLGGRLFGRQWISVQAVGVLLTAALVGAIAMTTRDRPLNAARG